ncbi:hypothetical protein AeRB84_008154 [Aphanomyces euteiches]|nr:hypothetical protein AeRB84_008154 [Aphanomyces euteiches]
MSKKTETVKESFDGDLRLRCNETFITQTLDHFTAHHATYQQRYFTCAEHWKSPDGPIFFYTGHESNAEEFLKATGLMWENAAEFGALLVFAEHRYFGKSFPKIENASYVESLRFLSSEQALADYAVLIRHLKTTLGAKESPVIAFGGSYAGMLAAWFRMTYPFVVDGSIASSVPLLAFDWDRPDFDPKAYGRITTFVGTAAAGSPGACIPNIRRAQSVIKDFGGSQDGRLALSKALRLCYPPSSQEEAIAVSDSLVDTYSSLAEANFPFPSTFFGDFPAYPYQVACSYLNESTLDDLTLLDRFRASVGVALNSSGQLACIDWNATQPIESENLWAYLQCSVDDFFRPHETNVTEDAAECKAKWGVDLRPDWAKTVYGGLDGIKSASNIVFTNGNFDPFSGYGISKSLSPPLLAIPIDGGAHHLDLMFSNENDPPSVRAARQIQRREIRKWIAQSRRHANHHTLDHT